MSLPEQVYRRTNIGLGHIAILRIKMAAQTFGKEMGQIVTELAMKHLPAVPNEDKAVTGEEDAA